MAILRASVVIAANIVRFGLLRKLTFMVVKRDPLRVMRQNPRLTVHAHGSRYELRMYTTLISAQDLNARRNAFVIVDCRFELAQIARPDAGRQAYAISHIPRAFYAHLDHDLAGSIV